MWQSPQDSLEGVPREGLALDAASNKGRGPMSDTATMAMLERRRLEAKLIAHVYASLVASHGEATARQTIADSIRRAAIEQGREVAAQAPGGTSLETFVASMEPWTRGNALEIEVKEHTATRYAFDVKRCAYARMYREMGLGHIGDLLSCQRDGTFCEGYDPKLKLKRTQTIMQGASHCDFEYTYEADAGRSAASKP
jgi:hypothetical protein